MTRNQSHRWHTLVRSMCCTLSDTWTYRSTRCTLVHSSLALVVGPFYNIAALAYTWYIPSVPSQGKGKQLVYLVGRALQSYEFSTRLHTRTSSLHYKNKPTSNGELRYRTLLLSYVNTSITALAKVRCLHAHYCFGLQRFVRRRGAREINRFQGDNDSGSDTDSSSIVL